MLIKLLISSLIFILFNCSTIHHSQIGEIDNTLSNQMRKFDIKISEMGFSHQEAAKIAGQFAGTNSKSAQQLKSISDLVSLFQMGPLTGKPVYVDNYANNLHNNLYKECPTGKITGLTIIRESRVYPVISGEIVRVIGYCIH